VHPARGRKETPGNAIALRAAQMSEFFHLIFSNPAQALAFLFLAVIVGLLELIRRVAFERFRLHEARLIGYEKSFTENLKQTRVVILRHSDDMGKATKAINGDMLMIQEKVFGLRQDFVQKSSELAIFGRELEQKTIALAHVFEANVEKFDAKLAHIINLRKELATLTGKVEQVETATGQFRITMGNVGKILKKHEDEIRGLKK
jgi:hypothetical protein